MTDVKFTLYEASEEAWDTEKTISIIRLQTAELPRWKSNAIVGRKGDEDGD